MFAARPVEETSDEYRHSAPRDDGRCSRGAGAYEHGDVHAAAGRVDEAGGDLHDVTDMDGAVELDAAGVGGHYSDRVLPFTIDPSVKQRLLDGIGDIYMTLKSEREIALFEKARPTWMPKTLPA